MNDQRNILGLLGPGDLIYSLFAYAYIYICVCVYFADSSTALVLLFRRKRRKTLWSAPNPAQESSKESVLIHGSRQLV